MTSKNYELQSSFNSDVSSPHFAENQNLVVVIAGPTASGKSDVAAEICSKFKGLIVSADSVQAYKGVQIGANKPDAAEVEQTPHILIDIADHTENYNAAEWRRDALFTIHSLLNKEESPAFADENQEKQEDEMLMAKKNRKLITETIQDARKSKNYPENQPVLPVVVGGTMMYLQWLVHGRPDALKPTEQALAKALKEISEFTENKNWFDAVSHVKSQGDIYSQQVDKLCGQDWYRLRRILEVAYTIQEKGDETLIEKLYSGIREGSLSSSGLDVRCFFLCPDDRMKHTKVIDERCEEMLLRGLLKETTDLLLSGTLPDMATKAIGYRQTIDYLEREDPKNDDNDAFLEYLAHFTTATRQYSKRQMQWFRKDEEFVFVPIPISKCKSERVDLAASDIARMISLPRKEFDQERLSQESTSAATRKQNEAQGKGMKVYQFEIQKLKKDSDELLRVMKEADSCTNQLQAKRSRKSD